MFDNFSQGIFAMGITGYLIIVPILRFAATLFMVLSTYKLLKARQDNHKVIWILAIVFSPVLARIAYEVYRRWIAKKEIKIVKGSTLFLIIAIVTFVLSVLLSIVCVISTGIGFIKSEIDGEPLAIFYDVYGNEYYDLYEVPLYDKEGNTYTYESGWFSAGTYVDQGGKTYDGEYCYLSKDGYFYYDTNDILKPCQNSYDYYTDGEHVFYYLFNRVYWGKDGTIWEFTGRTHLELFDFKE